MAVRPTTRGGYGRAEARRLRLMRHGVHVCRNCREAVRVTSPRMLPLVCPGCGLAGRDLWVPVGGERAYRAR